MNPMGAGRIQIWSSGRPGEVLVGAFQGSPGHEDPGGYRFHLQCMENRRFSRFLLWHETVVSPTASSPGQWPFHFTLPAEAVPSGLSVDGLVTWRLLVEGAESGRRKGIYDVVVKAGNSPSAMSAPRRAMTKNDRADSMGVRRQVKISKSEGGMTLSAPSPVAFPGPNPLVLWALSVTAFLMVMVKMKVSPWVSLVFLLVNAGALAVSLWNWFGWEEVCILNDQIFVGRRVSCWRRREEFPKEAIRGTRVVFSGRNGRYAVRLDRCEGLRPLPAFGGFVNKDEAHDAARTLNEHLKSSLR